MANDSPAETGRYLDPKNAGCGSSAEQLALGQALDRIVSEELQNDVFAMLGRFQRIMSDNRRRDQWDATIDKLNVLFKCGAYAQLDGPMIGVSMAIRDSDYFRTTAQKFGEERSKIAHLEWMATAWNATFANTGIWMGKTFEQVTKETFADKTNNSAALLSAYDPKTARIGRNFFREPANPNFLQGIGVPMLTKLWNLKDRPADARASGYLGTLTDENLKKEQAIPYSKTGGIFLSLPGCSVVPELNGKRVYQLNYRWPKLGPAYPMTRLIDELVQIADGVYLGQLVMATKLYSLGKVHFSLFGDQGFEWGLGEDFSPDKPVASYGYQNNGFFLMIDSAVAKEAYSDRAFPELRPRTGETGWLQLGYDKAAARPAAAGEFPDVNDWKDGWSKNTDCKSKFTTFTLEPSTKGDADGDVRELLQEGETILQMLQRIQKQVSSATLFDDHLRRFEPLNRLFRCGSAPSIANGQFQGRGNGYNVRFDAPEPRNWYGQPEPCRGFDYYHGATLNLHFGMADTFCTDIEQKLKKHALFPSALGQLLEKGSRGPDLMNVVWATIGRFIFPWAGKSFETVSGRKLSMILDESDDLDKRYPERVSELKRHPASWPHYDLVKKNRDHYWADPGAYAPHLKQGSWDRGMSDADKAYWNQEAAAHWVYGTNIIDSRILPTDLVFKALDMNYGAPLPSIQKLGDAGPSPFVRQGYVFMGVSDRESILPMNNGPQAKKRVFQLHYRYPMVGGALPIGFCLDEIVEIAQGLYLGQLIYATDFSLPFHSSVDPANYKYQLFGYFLLLDNTWERHRRAIGLDVNT
jgi:hypothetical protein